MTNPLPIFVSAHLCERLAERGLTLSTWAVWREIKDGDKATELYIVAPGLDHDGLYRALDLPEGVQPRIYRDTPAYTLSDMLAIIPGFCLSRKDPRETEVATFKIWQTESIRGEHSLPDACALMVLQMLEKRLIPIEDINRELLKYPIAP